jgi:hypothetical protein
MKVGAIIGLNDLEAVWNTLNGWRDVVALRQACNAGIFGDRSFSFHSSAIRPICIRKCRDSIFRTDGNVAYSAG